MLTDFDASTFMHHCSSLPLTQRRISEDTTHIEIPFLTAVRSSDIRGAAFKEFVPLDTMSKDYLSFRLHRQVPCDMRLFACVRLSNDPTDGRIPWVALAGHVIATEIRPGHVFRTVMRISQHRFVQMRSTIAPV